MMPRNGNAEPFSKCRRLSSYSMTRVTLAALLGLYVVHFRRGRVFLDPLDNFVAVRLGLVAFGGVCHDLAVLVFEAEPEIIGPVLIYLKYGGRLPWSRTLLLRRRGPTRSSDPRNREQRSDERKL